MNFIKIEKCNYNNGVGARVILWVCGCRFHCNGCHNSEIFSFTSGKEFTEKDKEYLFECIADKYITGLSILGGEPMDNISDNREQVIKLCNEVKTKFPTKDIWLWTGYELKNLPTEELNIDYLIDGQYDCKKPTKKLWRGSDNQKLYHKVNNKFILID